MLLSICIFSNWVKRFDFIEETSSNVFSIELLEESKIFKIMFAVSKEFDKIKIYLLVVLLKDEFKFDSLVLIRICLCISVLS